MLFDKKPKTDCAAIEPDVRQYVEETQEAYRQELIRQRLAAQKQRKEQAERTEPDNSGIKYSSREVNYDTLSDDYLSWEKKNSVMESFGASVLRIMKQKNLTPSKLYKKAGLDRKLFSRLKNDYMYQPNQITAIKFCLGLELTIEETEKLLEKAGYSLSKSQSFDLIIRYCIEHGYTDIDIVNEILKRLDEKEI